MARRRAKPTAPEVHPAVNAAALHALVDRVAVATDDPARIAALEDLSDAAAVFQARIEQAGEPRESLAELSARLGLD